MEQVSPPAGWYADPSGRNEHRYWSGSGWTDRVATRGQQSTDPVPPDAGPPAVERQPGWSPQGTTDRPPPPGTTPPGTTPPGAPPWAATGTIAGGGVAADLGPRFVVRIIDFVLVSVVNGILTSLVVAGIFIGTHAGVLDTWNVGRSQSYGATAVSSAISAVLTLGYFTLMESARGQTLGKMVMRLRTQGPGGERPTPEQALRRNAFTAIPILGVVPFLGVVADLLLIVALITIAVTISRNTATHRGWHDDFAGGTAVVRAG